MKGFLRLRDLLKRLFIKFVYRTVIMYPKSNEQLFALKAFAKALKVDFVTSTYNPDFVAKIKQRKKEVDTGKFTMLDPAKSIWENLG